MDEILVKCNGVFWNEGCHSLDGRTKLNVAAVKSTYLCANVLHPSTVPGLVESVVLRLFCDHSHLAVSVIELGVEQRNALAKGLQDHAALGLVVDKRAGNMDEYRSSRSSSGKALHHLSEPQLVRRHHYHVPRFQGLLRVHGENGDQRLAFIPHLLLERDEHIG